MEPEAPTLSRLRADLAALDPTQGAQRRALKLVLGWAEYAAMKEGAPFDEGRVRNLVELAVQQLSDEAELYAGAGDTGTADARRRGADALTPYR